MRSRGVAVLVAGVVLGSGACGGPAQQASPQKAEAHKPDTPDPRTEALLHSFAAAIVARDYASAYNAVAAERRASLPLSELQEAFGHYRDGLPDALKTEVQVEPYDKEAASLVPDELRDRIVAEAVVHFEPGDDLEGFSAHVWVLMESGEPKLATFYVED